MSSLGNVTVTCPTCNRVASFPATLSAPIKRGDNIVGRITIDMDAIRAHLLTHGPHDGEPLPIAA